MAFIKFAPFYTAFSIIVFYMMHMYNSLWRFASFNELTSIMMATVVTGTAHVVGITLFVRRMPIAYYVLEFVRSLFLQPVFDLDIVL